MPAAQPAATQVAPTSSTILDRLLLVAGTAIGVVVFCLMLLASRPRVQPAAHSDED